MEEEAGEETEEEEEEDASEVEVEEIWFCTPSGLQTASSVIFADISFY